MQTGAPALPAPVLEVCRQKCPDMLRRSSPVCPREKLRRNEDITLKKTKAPSYPYTEAQNFYQAEEEEEGKEEGDEVTGQQSVW